MLMVSMHRRIRIRATMSIAIATNVHRQAGVRLNDDAVIASLVRTSAQTAHLTLVANLAVSAIVLARLLRLHSLLLLLLDLWWRVLVQLIVVMLFGFIRTGTSCANGASATYTFQLMDIPPTFTCQ